ncbi:MAG: tetratricopeptide repeat protein [Pirellulales bacterium]|nr:tetratricopeptide repeat protein [Pirellulales bacterium]
MTSSLKSLAVLGAFASLVNAASALDQVRTTKATVNGTVQEITAQEIKVKKAGSSGDVVAVPVNEVISIKFDGEDPQVNLARSAVLDGRYEDGLRLFGELEKKLGDARPELQQDLKFYQAWAAAKLALAGSGDVGKAGAQMREFVDGNASSYHYFPAAEVLGDLFAAVGAYDKALAIYDKVAAAPWPEYQMRAAVARGRALVLQGKPDEALASFNKALDVEAPADNPQVAAQRLAATLGQATCLAATGKTDDAIKQVEGVILAANPEDGQLHAQAYNTLGNCLRKASRPKDALLAFLHVDLLYSAFPQAHAEALANLAELWTELKQAQRAQEAAALLQERYKNSTWAK